MRDMSSKVPPRVWETSSHRRVEDCQKCERMSCTVSYMSVATLFQHVFDRRELGDIYIYIYMLFVMQSRLAGSAGLLKERGGR